MDFKKILNISGQAGLYSLIASNKTSFIVESIDESKKRMPVSIASKVAVLEEVSVYTTDEPALLKTIIQTMFEQKGQTTVPTNEANPETLKNYLATVLPNYDKERVYVSDIKKLIKWYHILNAHFDLNTIGQTQATTTEDAPLVEAS